MKRIISLFLAILTVAAILTVGAAADEYILSMPPTIDAHNMTGFGLKTLYVFETENAPTLDGVVSTGEYPGPNNGLVSYVTKGNGLWISSQESGNVNSTTGRDYTDLIQDVDFPDYIKVYLTYDEKYLYAFVETQMLEAHKKNGLSLDTRLNFMQTSDLLANNASTFWNRYAISAGSVSTQSKCTGCSVFANDGSTNGRYVKLLKAAKDSKGNNTYDNSIGNLPPYEDEAGVKWNTASGMYTQPENTFVKSTYLNDGKWRMAMEYRIPLGDALRITDVEFDDGTNLSYVPEWGMFSVGIKYTVTEKTKDYALDPADSKNCYAYACTYLPANGYGQTKAASRIGDITFTNSIYAAMAAGKFTAGTQILNPPVAFLGLYDPTITPEEYKNIYAQGKASIAYSTRVTRLRNPEMTSGIRGVNGRVVGAASGASVSTGDNMTVLYVSLAAMIVFGAGSVYLISKRKKKN